MEASKSYLDMEAIWPSVLATTMNSDSTGLISQFSPNTCPSRQV